MSLPHYIIIVPHSVCPLGVRTLQQPCDELAAKAAMSLRSAISQVGLSVDDTIVWASQPRTVVDINRIRGRYDPSRYQLRNLARAATERGRRVVVIDVHSFPPGLVFGNYRLAVLDRPGTDFAVGLVGTLNQKLGPFTAAAYGIHPTEDDIHREMTGLGYEAVLFEYNENSEGGDVDQLNAVTATWLKARPSQLRRRMLSMLHGTDWSNLS